MSRLELALGEIVTARTYTERLLDHVEPDDWFRQPAEGVTHIAWQVGHLAMAEYRLALERIRGVRPDDGELIHAAIFELFGKDSVPQADASRYPPIEEIRGVFTRVHDRALKELANVSDDELDAPPIKSHPLFNTKLGSLLWCARHEMLHAGQIGLLRRLAGTKPLW